MPWPGSRSGVGVGLGSRLALVHQGHAGSSTSRVDPGGVGSTCRYGKHHTLDCSGDSGGAVSVRGWHEAGRADRDADGPDAAAGGVSAVHRPVLRRASSAMTTTLRRSDSSGCRSPLSSGRNFWIVVKTTPPDATCSRREGLLDPGRDGILAQQRVAAAEGAEELVVHVIPAGDDDQARVLHRRLEHDPPGVERHREALA